MILKYKTNNSSEIITLDTINMSVLSKLAFITKVFNFDIIILDNSGKPDDELRLEILNGKF